MTLVKLCGITELGALDAGEPGEGGQGAGAESAGLPGAGASLTLADADFLGLNFWPRSKRHAPLELAVSLAAAVRARSAAQLVGVFVNQPAADIASIARAVGLDVVQLHGDETPADAGALAAATGLPIWKALAIASPADLDGLDRWPVQAFLLDAPSAARGGAGVTFDWTLASQARTRYPHHRFVLAGGLTPANVAAAISAVSPWAVDVASGIERSPGVKDPARTHAFLAAARGQRS
jgi:phosphoribosylanthranilate isomerase